MAIPLQCTVSLPEVKAISRFVAGKPGPVHTICDKDFAMQITLFEVEATILSALANRPLRGL
jgi:hypothetical protein